MIAAMMMMDPNKNQKLVNLETMVRTHPPGECIFNSKIF